VCVRLHESRGEAGMDADADTHLYGENLEARSSISFSVMYLCGGQLMCADR